MKKKLYVVLSILILCGLAGFIYYQQMPKTVTMTVKEYEVDNSVGEDVEDGEDKEEFVGTTEVEVPVEEIEEMESLLEDAAEENSTEITHSLSFNKDSLKSKSNAGFATKVDEASLGLNGSINYYYYNTLDTNGKNIYRLILSGYQNRFDTFEVPVSAKDLGKYHDMVLYDHPEIFWTDNHYTYWDYGSYVKIGPKYNRSDAEIARDKQNLEKAIVEALKNAPRDGSSYDKTKYIFQYLINKVEYQLGVVDNQNVYSALVNKITVCAGYAKATQLLLQRLGVRCIYLVGTTTRGYHAWNIVKCGDHYYQVDTTWGDPNYSSGDNNIPEILQYDYAYLCVDDKTMYASRTADPEPKVPTCDATNLLFYPKNNRYFKKYGDEVKKSIKKNLKAGKSYWQGQFASDKAFNDMMKAVNKGMYSQLVYDVTGKSTTTWSWRFDDSRVVKLYY